MSMALESELKSWSASSSQDLGVGETKPELRFSKAPDLSCIVCKQDIKSSPVFQCQTGHLACAKCSQEGYNCPLCSKAISRIKNVAIGNIINSLLVACRLANLGCKEMIPFTAPRSEHEDICDFVPTKCPMPDCNQAGVKNLLHEHLAAKHKIHSIVDITEEDTSNKRKWCEWHFVKFNLDASDTLVLLRQIYSKRHHLLHQESTDLGDTKLYITSLDPEPPAIGCKRKYEIVVEFRKPEQIYCFKSIPLCHREQQYGGLLIPKMPDSVPSGKKHCTIRLKKFCEYP